MDELLQRATERSVKSTNDLEAQIADGGDAERQRVRERMNASFGEAISPLKGPEFPYLLKNKRDAEEDQHSDDAPDQFSESEPALGHGDHVVMVGDEAVYVWEYLGDEWSGWVRKLHAPPQEGEEMPEYIVANLHDWQRCGAFKMVRLAESSLHGAILGDEMGLGKTLTTISACEMLRKKYPGAFDVVVCPKGTFRQWDHAFWDNYREDCRLKVKVLNDPATTASELLAQRVDVVICSYQFIASRHKHLKTVRKHFEQAQSEDLSAEEVREAAKRTGVRPFFEHRPVSALHTSLYSGLGLPIRTLILDESQLAKNEGATHEALQDIDRRFTFMLSGTIFMNRWSDVYGGGVSFLKGHPFDTRASFNKSFAGVEGNSTIPNPSNSKWNRLVKFLLGAGISRPISLLDLPGLDIEVHAFLFTDKKVLSLVCLLVKKFVEAVVSGGMVNPACAGGKGARSAIYYATAAQQLVAHPHMISQTDRKKLDAMQEEASKLMDSYLTKYPAHQEGSLELYVQILDCMRKDAGMFRNQMPSDDPGEQPLEAPSSEPIDTEMLAAASQTSESLGRASGDGAGEPRSASGSLFEPDGEEMAGADPDEEYDDDDDDDDDVAGDTAAPAPPRDRQEFLDEIKGLSVEEVRSPRIIALLDVLRKIGKCPGAKTLVFSRFLKFLDIADRAIGDEFGVSLRIFRYDSSVQDKHRVGVVEQFGRHEGPAVMLITSGCGGAGLNITSASFVVLCEPWWRAPDEMQAIHRAYRKGQEKEVQVIKLFGSSTMIDALLREISQKKAAVNDPLQAALRRRDDEDFVIPKIHVGAGE
ncbi:uncharacterized protein LTR77_004274 [Saxophila tyrrhenica]|uniref:Uncharacterized protein n=1 Tax=Saxophila tyrrhenica TaxID=1690608 RepID=A0AAV9PFG6_9PEZI|nr:hypothetical protein LTR77_004274 [Saxophila tyrrhenica]